MYRAARIGALLAIFSVATACQDDGLAPTDGLNGDDVAQLALASDLLEGNLLFAEAEGFLGGPEAGMAAALDGTDDRHHTRDFHRERDCPAGGVISVNGTIEKVANGEGTVEFFINGRGVHDDCSFQRRRYLLTLNGEFRLEAYRKLVNREPVGPQTLSKAGWFEYTKTNEAGEVVDRGRCEYELTSVWIPDAGTRTVTGIFCGREIDRTVDWRRERPTDSA